MSAQATSQPIRSDRVAYDVKPTGREHPKLGPVTLSIETGAVRLSDYLSCDQARDLGAALMAAALKHEAEAEGISERTAFDEHVDAKLAELKFLGVPDRLARDVQSFVGDPLDMATGEGRR